MQFIYADKCVCVFFLTFCFTSSLQHTATMTATTKLERFVSPPLSLSLLYSPSNSRITEAPPISPAHPMSESDSSGSSSSSDSSSDSSDCDEDNEQGQEKRGGRLPEAPLPMEEEDHAWEKVGMIVYTISHSYACIHVVYIHHCIHTLVQCGI